VERAHAVTITSSHTSPIDFGNVMVGSSANILFTTQFFFAAGETINHSSDILDNFFGDFTVDILNPAGNCNDPGFICNWNITFAPNVAGFQSSGPWQFLLIGTHQGTSDSVSLLLQGTGVAAIPLPAAFPLFGTGLGIMTIGEA
jgi:hypothetical protein